MEATRLCSACRKPLPQAYRLAVCPACLIQAGFDTPAASPAAEKGWAPPPVEEVARWLPQYEVLALVGHGGMGAVYKARQPALSRLVALKVLPPALAADPGFAERFNREAQALARLNHPHIVAVYEFGQAGPLHYFVMEFVEGPNLRELSRTDQLTLARVLEIVPQICDALQFAHSEGIVHRDIKPENILLDRRWRVKITDFGLAKIVGPPGQALGLTEARQVVGTPHYIAPEQIERPQAVDHRADIYSLGVVLYELLTGELPLGLFAPPSAKSPADPRLDSVVMRALEKEPARRYQQAGHVKRDVQAIADTPAAVLDAVSPGRRRVGLAATLAAGLVLVAAFVIVAASWVRTYPDLWYGLTGKEPRTGEPSIKTPAPETKAPLVAEPKEVGPPSQRSPQPLALSQPQFSPPASIPSRSRELAGAELSKALSDLKSSEWGRRQLAVSQLAESKLTERREEVLPALAEAMTDSQSSVRETAARALGNLGGAEVQAPLIAALGDLEFSVRWSAIEALGRLKTPEAANALAGHLSQGADLLETAHQLERFGPGAEPAVTSVLGSKNADARREACRILGAIGTASAVKPLQAALADADPAVALVARSAIAEIKRRPANVSTDSLVK